MEYNSESDSDFYGQAEMVNQLKARVRLAHAEALSGALKAMVAGAQDTSKVFAATEQTVTRTSNPFAGVAYAWQLGERVKDFVSRLPPSTTVADARTPWIYVCNPHVARRKKADAENQLVAGCEDESPETENAQTRRFVDGANERLDLLRSLIDGTAKMGFSLGAAAEMERARIVAARDVLSLASILGVTCGKWMLFVHPDIVDTVWETIACATIRGGLGVAAKVAPQRPDLNGEGEAHRTRLICIYTSDFRDRRDVGRVLQAITDLGLREPHGKGRIYYKCDAYTYLGIGGKNPWGIRPSLYSSSDFRVIPDTA